MLQVTPDVLTPRPDTETVVELVLRDLPGARAVQRARPGRRLRRHPAGDPGRAAGGQGAGRRRLRGGAGGGARERRQPGPGRPRGPAARRLDARAWPTRASTWWSPTRPISPAPRSTTLEPEVRDHEPRLALDGGPDGLDAYRLLAPEILRVLKPGGRFAVEIGYDQKAAVEALFRGRGRGRRRNAARTSPTATGWSPARILEKPLGNPGAESLDHRMSPPKSSELWGRRVQRRTRAPSRRRDGCQVAGADAPGRRRGT